MSQLYLQPRHPNEEKKVLLFIILFMIAVFVTAALQGCVSEKHFAKLAAEHPNWLKQSDSITTKVDTVYKPKPYEVTVKGNDIYHDSLIAVPCPDEVKEVTNKGASQKISQVGKVLTDTCRCDSLQGVVIIMQAEIDKLVKEKIVKVIPPKQPNFFERLWEDYKNFATWFTSIILVIILSYVGFRAFNVIKKIPGFPF